jgi:hypothetical protein
MRRKTQHKNPKEPDHREFVSGFIRPLRPSLRGQMSCSNTINAPQSVLVSGLSGIPAILQHAA